jgi:hypothetical protein
VTVELVAIFFGGVLGSAHCLGMCGGFAMAIGATKQPLWPMLSRQLAYTSGRIATYAFLGAIAAFAGLYLSRFQGSLLGAQRAFSILAGVIMLYVGLGVFGLIPWNRKPGAGLLAPLFAHFINARGRGGFFLAGLANGFLPCGLVYAFLAAAAATSDIPRGMLIMICFGLGTAPAMIALGCGTGLLSRTARVRVHRLAAAFVILLGGVTIWRGVPALGSHCAPESAADRHAACAHCAGDKASPCQCAPPLAVGN